jgi:hypothetical protein
MCEMNRDVTCKGLPGTARDSGIPDTVDFKCPEDGCTAACDTVHKCSSCTELC